MAGVPDTLQPANSVGRNPGLLAGAAMAEERLARQNTKRTAIVLMRLKRGGEKLLSD
jgi:hypothetical protein